MTTPPLDPDTMTVEQLREEAWFWRANAAASLFFALVDLRHHGAGGTFRSRRALTRRIRELVELLDNALTGDLHQTCGICGEPLRPGQAALSDLDMGDVHAHCSGDPIGRAAGEPAQPGDRIQCDPESIVDADGDPMPDTDGILTAYPIDRLYTTADLLAKVAEARELLRLKGARHA